MALIRFNFRSRTLHGAANVNILIPTAPVSRDAPPDLVPGVRYQVLWLLHGGDGDENDFLLYSNIAAYAERERLAVVMPSCPEKFYAGKYYDYVLGELPETLRILFPFSPARRDNFIGGLSHGGDCALRAALEHPDRYAAALVMSAAGTTHFSDRPNELLFDVYGPAEKNAAAGTQTPLIFATGSGDRGFPAYTPVIDRLEALGTPLTRQFVDGDGHSWPFWDRTLDLALSTLLPVRHCALRAAES